MMETEMTRKRYTIEDMQRLAEERGGKCLSKEYINNHRKLEWQCSNGHIWRATPHNVKQGSWCPRCAKLRIGDKLRDNIENMQRIANKRGGKCLSTKYIDANTKLIWQCSEGHIWHAKPCCVKQGTWCPICSSQKNQKNQLTNRKSIQDAQILAQARGGRCLSIEYQSNRRKLKWECAEGHIWEANFNSIQQGRWCPICYNNNRAEYVLKYTIKDMRKLAEERGGKCLSNEYLGAQIKMTWQCSEGHIWDAKSNSIMNGGWCPDCRIWVGEEVCREIFSKLFNKPFKKSHPTWLKNPNTKGWLELDGYNMELNLAFEFNGVQHYISNEQTYFNSPFVKQQRERDRIKGEICKNNGVHLIVIPYYIKHADKLNYIISKCKELGYTIPKEISIELYDYRTIKLYNKNRLDEIKRIINEWGGECLSDTYLDISTPMKFRCSRGHIWETSAASIKKHKCPVCSGNTPLTIDEMHNIAQDRGGKCLSIKYVNSHTHLKWQCAEGHIWSAKSCNIKTGGWCPICGRKKQAIHRRRTIQEMNEIAQEHGGYCLSTDYKDNKTKLLWKCSKDHEWWATPHLISRGAWCPVCSGNTKLIIREMFRIAFEHGGLCLSTEYKNNKTKLLWRCANGHEWLCAPSDIKQGRWCPTCFKIEKATNHRINTLNKMKQLAIERGGYCLSDSYVDSSSLLRWKCAKGHEWYASPSNVKMGTWCPKCKGKKAWETRRRNKEK